MNLEQKHPLLARAQTAIIKTFIAYLVILSQKLIEKKAIEVLKSPRASARARHHDEFEVWRQLYGFPKTLTKLSFQPQSRARLCHQ